MLQVLLNERLSTDFFCFNVHNSTHPQLLLPCSAIRVKRKAFNQYSKHFEQLKYRFTKPNDSRTRLCRVLMCFDMLERATDYVHICVESVWRKDDTRLRSACFITDWSDCKTSTNSNNGKSKPFEPITRHHPKKVKQDESIFVIKWLH